VADSHAWEQFATAMPLDITAKKPDDRGLGKVLSCRQRIRNALEKVEHLLRASPQTGQGK
jgi:hypothetical protein